MVYNEEHGCLKHSTIKILKSTLTWVSYQGIAMLGNGGITIITKDKLNKINFSPIGATVYNEEYYLTLEDGTLFIVDVRFNPNCFKTREYPLIEVYNTGAFDNVLYAAIQDRLVILEDGQPINFHYRSGKITEGDASVVKMYNNIYISANGRFIVDIYIDDIKVHSEEINGNKVFDIQVPQEKQRGYSIQFDILGTGSIAEIEWKVIGRDNGR